MKIPTIKECERAIGIPASKWDGRCYEIAVAILQAGLVDGRAVYGHWTGDVNPDGYWGGRRGLAFINHGWIELEDGRILDPTRWSFEGVEPYIFCEYPPDDSGFVCACGHVTEEHGDGFFKECDLCDCPDFQADEPDWPYDEGGNRWRAAAETPPPAYDPQEEVCDLELPAETLFYVCSLFGDPLPETKRLTKRRVFWLANLAVARLGSHAKPVFQSIVAKDLGALIPIDNRRMVLGGR